MTTLSLGIYLAKKHSQGFHVQWNVGDSVEEVATYLQYDDFPEDGQVVGVISADTKDHCIQAINSVLELADQTRSGVGTFDALLEKVFMAGYNAHKEGLRSVDG